MRELMFHLRKALETAICSGTPPSSASTWRCFDRDRASIAVADRIRQDVDSGLASGQVLGTPTLFIDGVVHSADYDPHTLLAALAPVNRSARMPWPSLGGTVPATS